MKIKNETHLQGAINSYNARAKAGKRKSYEAGRAGFRLVSEDMRLTKCGVPTNTTRLFEWGEDYPQLSILA